MSLFELEASELRGSFSQEDLTSCEQTHPWALNAAWYRNSHSASLAQICRGVVGLEKPPKNDPRNMAKKINHERDTRSHHKKSPGPNASTNKTHDTEWKYHRGPAKYHTLRFTDTNQTRKMDQLRPWRPQKKIERAPFAEQKCRVKTEESRNFTKKRLRARSTQKKYADSKMKEGNRNFTDRQR